KVTGFDLDDTHTLGANISRGVRIGSSDLALQFGNLFRNSSLLFFEFFEARLLVLVGRSRAATSQKANDNGGKSNTGIHLEIHIWGIYKLGHYYFDSVSSIGSSLPYALSRSTFAINAS